MRRLLKRLRVPMPSMMVWGERRMRSRWMSLGWVAGGSTINSVASSGAGGSEFAHSAPVWPHEMVLKVFSSQALRDASSRMVSYLFCGLPSCLSKYTREAMVGLSLRNQSQATRRASSSRDAVSAGESFSTETLTVMWPVMANSMRPLPAYWRMRAVYDFSISSMSRCQMLGAASRQVRCCVGMVMG